MPVHLAPTTTDTAGIIGMPEGAQVRYAPAHPANYSENPNFCLGLCFHTPEFPFDGNPEWAAERFQTNLEMLEGTGTSYAYYVDSRGWLWQFVRDHNSAQHVALHPAATQGVQPSWYRQSRHFGYNRVMIGIAVQGYAATVGTHVKANDPRDHYDRGSPQFQALAAIAALKCWQHSIPISRDRFFSHRELDQREMGTRRRDPGDNNPRNADTYFPMLELMDEAERLLRKHQATNPQVSELDFWSLASSGALSTLSPRPVARVPEQVSFSTAPGPLPDVPTTVFALPRPEGPPTGSTIRTVADGKLVPRKLRLVVGGRGSPETPGGQGEPFTLEVTADQRVVFKVQHSQETDDKPWTIEVFNLSEETENAVAERGQSYTLEAGYGDNLGIIAEGDVFAFERLWRAPDRILRMHVRKHQTLATSGTIAQGWYSIYGSTRLTVLQDLTRAAGLILGPTDHLPELLLDAHWMWNDNAYAGLKKYVALLNLEMVEIGRVVQLERTATVRIQTGTEVIAGLPPVDSSYHTGVPETSGTLTLPIFEEADEDREFVHLRLGSGGIVQLQRNDFLITEATGLVGHVARTDQGFKATLRLSNELFPLRRVTVQSQDVQGRFIISSVTHQGDTWGGDFLTSIEGYTIPS